MYRTWNLFHEKQKQTKLIFLQKKHVGIILFFFGIFFLGIPIFYSTFSSVYPVYKNKNVVVTPLAKNFNEKKQLSPPKAIVIPSVAINLPIVEAPVVHGYWQTSDTTASHGVGSANPGETGNIVVFAHARIGLFLPLKNITKLSRIYLYTEKKKYTYEVTNITFVTPDDIQVISQTADARLTLFTCSGFMDSKRLIVVAKPVKT